MRKVYVIQKPPKPQNFDMKAVEELGEVVYMAPSAPNIHDPERIKADYQFMLACITSADPDDVFLALGGSPVTNWIFGAALFASGVDSIKVAMYSRDINHDGARLTTGSYRVVDMTTDFPEAA